MSNNTASNVTQRSAGALRPPSEPALGKSAAVRRFSSEPGPLDNHLLAALPEADYARLAAHLELTAHAARRSAV